MNEQWNVELVELIEALEEWEHAQRKLDDAKWSAIAGTAMAFLFACSDFADVGIIPAKAVGASVLLLAVLFFWHAAFCYGIWRVSEVRSVNGIVKRLKEVADVREKGA